MRDLYGIFVKEENRVKLFSAILNIRPAETKIYYIGWLQGYIRLNVVLSKEELAFVKLAVPFALKEVWIQKWRL